MNRTPSTETAFRIGSAVAGMLTGLVLGLLSAITAVGVLKIDLSFPIFVFGGSVIGALIGLAIPAAARSLAEGTVHFVIGLLSGTTYGTIKPSHDAPRWLKYALWAGILVGFLLIVLVRR